MTNDKTAHQNAADTERRSYDRLRESGVTPEAARSIAKDAARQTHTNLDRRK